MRDLGTATRRRRTATFVTAFLLGLLPVASAHAAISLPTFSTTFHDPSGTPVTQAGAHADMTTRFTFGETSGTTLPIPAPDGRVKDVIVDLPVGFYGNPQAGELCDPGTFTEFFLGGCRAGTQVGVVDILGPLGSVIYTSPVYNIKPRKNETAVLGFNVISVQVKVVITPRTEGDHGLQARIENINQATSIYGTRMTLWGVPADPVHDPQRYVNGPFGSPGGASSSTLRPFLSLPATCDGPLEARIEARAWEDESTWASATSAVSQMTGCDKLKFDAGISVRPTSTQADTPTGFSIGVQVPQSESYSGLATPQLRKAVVKLPEGVAISPGSANGLAACADDRTGLGSRAAPACPDGSKIGTVRIDTPLLEDPLEGEVILRSPQAGELFRLMIVARGPGLVIKLPGVARPDPRTGQITATFDNTPQLPFSAMELELKGGPRAPLTMPQGCGPKTTEAEFTSWAGNVVRATSSFDVTGCTGGFSPSFEAGTLNPLAGGFSPFTMTIRRADGQEDISSLSLDMPSGLLGSIKGIPQCPEPQAAAGTCGESSRIGTTTVEAGPGSTPFPLQGKVFLAGPYKGAPFSLSVAVRAIAGPFDLGMVVVRAPIHVDAATAKLAVPSDPLPTILEGVPLRLRTINITMDRPGFTFNATNCTPQRIGARIVSTSGAVATPSVPYQAQGCAALPLEPKLALTLSGAKETTDGKHPGINATLVQKPGESGLKKVSVKLPLSLALDPDNAQALCKPEQAAAKNCPAASIIGRATAVTPALNEPLTGPIYFVENTRRTASGATRRTLPRLWLALRGEVPLDLYAQSAIDDEHLVTTFDLIPDAPISRFDLRIDGGKNGVIVANTNICQSRQVTDATFDGQSGKRARASITMGLPCGFKVAKRTRKGRSFELTVSGLRAGKVKIAGDGIKTVNRTVKRASIARFTASLDEDGRKALASKGEITAKVTVTFTPVGGKARRTTTTLTYR